MNIDERLVGTAVILMISGDVTMGGANRVSERVRGLLHSGRYHIVLDLARVRYVDSAGLGELVQAYAAVKNRGGALKLLNLSKRLSDLLVVSRLLTVFDSYQTEAEAVASFGAHALPR